MITVSSDYKDAVRDDAVQRLARVETSTDTLEESDDLIEVSIISNGDFGKVVIRKAEIIYSGDHNLLGESLTISLGVVLTWDIYGQPATTEYINYGSFVCDKIEYNPETGTTKAICYDALYTSLTAHELMGINFPCTLKEYVEGICSWKGWTLGTSSFTNDDLVVADEYYLGLNLSLRDVLARIAEITGTIVRMSNEDELLLTPLSTVTAETLTTSDLFTADIEQEWGALNSILAISQSAGTFVYNGGYLSDIITTEDEEDIYTEDSEGITIESVYPMSPLYQFRMDDNAFAWQGSIDNLHAALVGYAYSPFKVRTVGLGYLEIGDRIKISAQTDADTNILSTEIRFTEGGYSEIYEAKKWERDGETIYKTAGLINKAVGSVITSISANRITSGTLQYNTTILINDGDTDRILIGYQEGGF